MSDRMHILGHMTFVSLSGGFWGIVDAAGKRYRPVQALPDAFQVEGLRVSVQAVASHGFSIFMWGTDIHIHQIEPA